MARKPSVDALTTASAAARILKSQGDPELARFQMGFMRARKGEYAEGDRFHGLKVPAVRAVASRCKAMPLEEIEKLLASVFHEERLLAVVILVDHYRREKSPAERERIARFYLAHLDGVNHWDLVDLSAGRILGGHLLERDRSILYEFARSRRLWTRRVSIMATQGFIARSQLDDTFRLAELLLHDEHDLIHKAVGWMLREAGKRDVARLKEFLGKHCREMPRTMLRYALEKLPERERRRYMRGEA